MKSVKAGAETSLTRSACFGNVGKRVRSFVGLGRKMGKIAI